MAQIGDLVPKAGIYTQSGVVTERKPDGSVTVDTDPMMVNKYHRYANTSGLDEREKKVFNEILDQIYQKNDDVEKINDIQTEIDKLKTDPANQNIVQYLRNQQSYLVRQAKSLPRMYNWEEDKIA
jgi:FtsZ-binding cell division protein ZapB